MKHKEIKKENRKGANMRIDDGSNKSAAQQNLLNKIKDRYRVRKDINDIRNNIASDNTIEKCSDTDKNYPETFDTLVLSEEGRSFEEDGDFKPIIIGTLLAFRLPDEKEKGTWEEQMLLEYARFYDYIVRGYNDGTVEIHIHDNNSETGYKKLSMQEALAELDDLFASLCEEHQKDLEEGRESLKEMAEEAEDLIKRYGTAGPWYEEALERYNLVKDQEIPKDLGKRVYNASKVFIQRYKQASDVLSIEEMLKGITI